MEENKLDKYPQTNIYKVIDIIGVPHPYCIGPKHVEHASDYFGGLLGEYAIESAEKKGIFCCICKGDLKYHDHKQALLIGVNFDGELKDAPGLREYLLSIKEEAENDKFEGFAFKKGW